MANIIEISNTKKSRAAYYREYRKKQAGQKMQSETPKIRLNAIKGQGGYTLGIATLSLLTTAYLVFLSIAFFEGSFGARLALSILSETLLLALVFIKTNSKMEAFFRLILLAFFCSYSVLPFVFEPVKSEDKVKASLNLIHLEQESLKREVAKMTLQHSELVALKRITRAENIAQQLAITETQLRNSYEQEKSLQTKSLKVLPGWILALQRLLFVAVNMFFVHHLSNHLKASKKSRSRSREVVVTKLCRV